MTYREIRRKRPLTPNYSVIAQSRPEVGWVLIVGGDDSSEVKIGYGSDLRQRFAQYCSQHFFGDSDTHLLAAVRATELEETALHTYFDFCKNERRIRRGRYEFFHAHDDLLDYIAFLRSHYFVIVDDVETAYVSNSRTYSDMASLVIAPEHWLPGNGHAIKERAEPNLFTHVTPWGFFPARNITGDDYYTPADVMECVHNALGEIDLDPASHAIANSVIKAKRFYNRDENGLERSWAGRVWLNPPFSIYEPWAIKALEELDRGEVTELLMLVNSRALTANYFAPILKRAAALVVMTGRKPFWGVSDGKTSGAQGNAIVCVHGDVERFGRAFSDMGVCFRSSL